MTATNQNIEAVTPIPTEYLCGLTKKIMREPMMSKYGHHYEKSEILRHLEANEYCPVTGNSLKACNLVSNKTLQWKIKYWAKKNGIDRNARTASPDESRRKTNSTTTVRTSTSSASSVTVPPSQFLCPLTKSIMRDPVTTTEGVNYERKAILRWLECCCDDSLCPVTATPLTRRGLSPNVQLQQEIEQWQKLHQQQQHGINNSTVNANQFSSTTAKIYGCDPNTLRSSLVRSLPTGQQESNSLVSSNSSNTLELLEEALDSAIQYSLRV